MFGLGVSPTQARPVPEEEVEGVRPGEIKRQLEEFLDPDDLDAFVTPDGKLFIDNSEKLDELAEHWVEKYGEWWLNKEVPEDFRDDYREGLLPIEEVPKECAVENNPSYFIVGDKWQYTTRGKSFFERHPTLKKALAIGVAGFFIASGGYALIQNLTQEEGIPNDKDLDGASNSFEENVLHTDPEKTDTSGDGIPDGLAYRLGRNPLEKHQDLSDELRRMNLAYSPQEQPLAVVMPDGGITPGIYVSENDQFYGFENDNGIVSREKALGPLPSGQWNSYQDLWKDISKVYGPFKLREENFETEVDNKEKLENY